MTQGEIKRHKLAAKRLLFVKDQAFKFIKTNLGKISEYDVSQFIVSEIKKNNLELEKGGDIPIVAVNKNTSYVHYFPKKNSSYIIGKNNLVLIDMWGKLKEKRSPFADITWMGYVGKPSQEIIKTFNDVIKARDIGVEFIKAQLKTKKIPKAREVDIPVRGYFKKLNKGEFFKHTTGHSLGFSKCHGEKFNFSEKEKRTIIVNVPFTIEPGLYFENRFGIRSEIDCYINEDYKLIITTEVQKELVII